MLAPRVGRKLAESLLSVVPPQRNATLNAFKFLRNAYLCYFSQPVADRALYQLLRKRQVMSIVEIGVGNMLRTKRLLEVAAQKTALEQIKYAGMDLFEARAASTPGLSLKQAHKELKPIGVKVQLVPGDPLSALARCANGLARTDLIVISAGSVDAMAKAWFYLPRMLHDGSQVFLEEPSDKGQTKFRLLKRLEIEQMASSAARAMRRAA
jgi:hypothetical protein